MTADGSTLYHPVSLNREYLAGKMLERYAGKDVRTWSDFSIGRRIRVREEFLAAIGSLEESLATGSPAFLLEDACWQQSRFAAGGFPENFAHAFFQVFQAVVLQELPEDYRKTAGAFARKAVAALKSTPAGAVGCRDAGTPLSPEARSFLASVLSGDEAGGRAVVDRMLAAGTPVREVYTGVFQPVLHETGRLWQMDKATIAQEHYVTAVVRRIMEQLHEQVAATGRAPGKRKTVVAACVGEELHEVGIRMVADFFVMDGWNVYYTGANTPPKSILAAVREQKADVVALSITMPSRLSDLRYLVRSLRADEKAAKVKVIVGGYPFAIMPELGERVGADAVAAGAEEAVAIASQLTRETPKKSRARAAKKT